MNNNNNGEIKLLLSAKSRETGGFLSELWRAGLPAGVSCRFGDDLAVGESGCRGDEGTSCRRAEIGEFSSKLSFLGEAKDGLLCFGGEPSRPALRLQPLSSP